MIRIRQLIVAALALVAVAGCARPASPNAAAPVAAPSAVPSATPSAAAASPGVDIAVQVLRRYVGTPSDNSIPGRVFPLVYVIGRTFSDAAEPTGRHDTGVAIPPEAQQQIAAALAPGMRVVFVADRAGALETTSGCAHVKDDAMLVTLGTPVGDEHRVTVGVNGFVACQGATWLTYVVQYQSDTGWQVTGTTGGMAIA